MVPQPAPLSSNPPVRDHLDRALRDVRISVLDRCNFRCPYCMPEAKFAADYAFMPRAQWLSDGQWLLTIKVLQQLGMRKLRITGGEPLLRKGIGDLIASLKSQSKALGLELEIALTTNASQLQTQALALKTAGLDRLTVSIDSLDPNRFAQLSGGKGDLAQVLAGLEAARAAGFKQIKLNCVVQKGINEQDVLAMCENFKAPHWSLRFIEYMDVGTQNQWRADQVVPSTELIELIHQRFPLEWVQSQDHSEVAQRYRYQDGSSEIGFISSISKPFCRACVRARLSADGKFYTCLFNGSGHDLRAAIESGDESVLRGLIASIWRARSDRYSELRAAKQGLEGESLADLAQNALAIDNQQTNKAEMYHLGG